MELEDLKDELSPDSIGECSRCGSDIIPDDLDVGWYDEAQQLRKALEEKTHALGVANREIERLAKLSIQKAVPAVSTEPRYIDAIRRSCLSESDKAEVIGKLRRIASSGEAEFREKDGNNYGYSELPYCEFGWSATEERSSYWSDIYNEIQKCPLESGKPIVSPDSGVQSMASLVFDVTVIGVSTNAVGAVDERIIDEARGILAPDAQTASYLAGVGAEGKKVALKSGEKLVIKTRYY